MRSLTLFTQTVNPGRQIARRVAACCALYAVVLVLAVPGWAQGNGLAFLALDPDPVGQGVGGAYSAAGDGPFAPLFNPAGLASASGNAVGLSVQDWLGDARTVALGGRFAAGQGGLGLFVIGTTSGELEARDLPGPSQGTFEVQYFAVGAGYARRFGALSLGVAAKAISERVFDASAGGFAADAGVQLQPIDGFRVGAAVQHLGQMSELGIERTPLPTTVRGGVTVRPFQLVSSTANETLLSTALHVEVVHRAEQEEPTQVRVGAEAALFDLITVRAGYVANDPVRKFSAGAGLAAGPFQIDYALLPLDAGFGTGQLIAVRYGW